MARSSAYEQTIADLFESIGTDEFGASLAGLIGSVIEFDGACLIFFHEAHSPKVLYKNLPDADEAAFQERYIRGAYLLDPFFRLCEIGSEGMYRLEDITAPGFRATEYFTGYIKPAGIGDEVDYVFQRDSGVSGLLSISRSIALDSFAELELEALNRLQPIATSAVNAHFKTVGNLFATDDVGYRPALLRQRLQQFGEAVLTPREHEIVHLMLTGDGSKALARELGISAETERTHRKNIYAKMNINSHAELLAAAIDFLLLAES